MNSKLHKTHTYKSIMSRHILIKPGKSKDKENILETAKEKWCIAKNSIWKIMISYKKLFNPDRYGMVFFKVFKK